MILYSTVQVGACEVTYSIPVFRTLRRFVADAPQLRCSSILLDGISGLVDGIATTQSIFSFLLRQDKVAECQSLGHTALER